MEADFLVGAFATLGDKVDKTRDAFMQNRLVPGLHKVAVGSITTPSSVTGAIYLPVQENVAAGRTWDIRSAAIYGADAHTVVASVIADFYVGSPGSFLEFPGEANPVLADNIGGGFPVPSVQTYGQRIYWAKFGEKPYCLLYSAPANTQFVFRVTYTDYRVEDAEEQRI